MTDKEATLEEIVEGFTTLHLKTILVSYPLAIEATRKEMERRRQTGLAQIRAEQDMFDAAKRELARRGELIFPIKT